MIDPDGERLTLIDDEGHVLTDTESLLALVTLVTDHLLGDSIALPVTVTSKATDDRRSKGIKVADDQAVGPGADGRRDEPGVGFAASGDGGFILPGFLPAFDAAATFVKVLDLLAPQRRAALVGRRRSAPHCTSRTRRVVTPWEQKGTVMRSLVEHIEGPRARAGRRREGAARRRLGARAARPRGAVTHVWAEAGSDADARRLAQEYARRIRQMLR